jgi:hypothetical protein
MSTPPIPSQTAEPTHVNDGTVAVPAINKDLIHEAPLSPSENGSENAVVDSPLSHSTLVEADGAISAAALALTAKFDAKPESDVLEGEASDDLQNNVDQTPRHMEPSDVAETTFLLASADGYSASHEAVDTEGDLSEVSTDDADRNLDIVEASGLPEDNVHRAHQGRSNAESDVVGVELNISDDRNEGDDQDLESAASNINPIEYVSDFFAKLELQVGYDDSLTQRGKPLTAHTRSMINSVLAVRALTLLDVLDMMIIDCKEKENKLKAGEVRAALRHVVGEMKHARRNAIIAPLLVELPAEAAVDAEREWRRIDSLFEPIPNLRASLPIMHFIWQVKTKVLGREVDHHLMPVITSSIQGSGKTTFVRSLLAPLKELVTGASLLSDFSDRRTLGLFRYLVAVLDDMEMISEKQVPVLKSIITGEAIHRRLLGSSMDAKVRQMSTPIGTSNSRIEELVPDNTGHRRFITLLFRNGAVAKGGDPLIWQTVSSLDCELMWRSINPFAPSPLAGHLVALTQYQTAATAPSALTQFLIALDLNHPDVRSISYRNQGVQAQGLHDLYEARTGKQLTKQVFAKEMFICMQNPMVPFGDKHRFGDMRVYRYRTSGPAAAITPPDKANPESPSSQGTPDQASTPSKPPSSTTH